MSERSFARKAATGVGVASVGAAMGTGAASVVGAAWFARRVLTPDRRRPDDTWIHAVDSAHILLDITPETIIPGRYGLWTDSGRGHLRVGDIIAADHAAGVVRRAVEGVDAGTPVPGPARWSGYYYGTPPDVSLGVPLEQVAIDSEVGPMPAWEIPGDSLDDSGRWAILVHGRGATRHECLRGVTPARALRHTCLIPAYRNDEDAPSGPDGRYNLGLSEWRDIEAAMTYAVARGARSIVLFGWSMGGAIVLQTLDRSALAHLVAGVVLDAPVVDWVDVMRHHARQNRVPSPIHRLSHTIMGRRWSRRLVGVHEAVDVARTDWVARADELCHRILLVHSRDDEFVPVGPSRELARLRPDLVTWEPWEVARHCKEWNTDSARWDRVVGSFLAGLG